MKVTAIVFLFLIRLRFPQSKSLSHIIRRRYGDNIIKRLRKFEKIDYRLRKAELNLEFLVKCRDDNVIPKFLKCMNKLKLDLRNFSSQDITIVLCLVNTSY